MILFAAYFLDLVVGDPKSIPHPIIFIGNMISKGESLARAIFKNEFIGGMILTLCVVFISFILPYFILYFIYSLSSTAGILVEIFFCMQILATKSLKSAAILVYHELKSSSIAGARKYLSYLVGRDTEALDEQAILRATVESVSENTSDGVIAPLFFIAIGGAPLGFLYKAVNTLDSMIGYKSEKYINFGKFAARLDDVLNFIPSRITGVLYIVSSVILGYNWIGAFNIFMRDRFNHASPNSAQIESACAGALNIQLGGDSYYQGVLMNKATIGDSSRLLDCGDILSAIKLMYVSSFLALLIFSALRWLII